MLSIAVELTIAFMLICGSLTALIGAIGMLRFKDFYMRMHAQAMSATLALGFMIIGSIIFFSYQYGKLELRELILTLFIMITAPVSAHLLTMSALHLKLPRQSNTSGGPFELNEEIDQN